VGARNGKGLALGIVLSQQTDRNRHESRELLASMHQAGARLVAQGVEMTALVEEIAGTRRRVALGS
jgi:hypothetical protein